MDQKTAGAEVTNTTICYIFSTRLVLHSVVEAHQVSKPPQNSHTCSSEAFSGQQGGERAIVRLQGEMLSPEIRAPMFSQPHTRQSLFFYYGVFTLTICKGPGCECDSLLTMHFHHAAE